MAYLVHQDNRRQQQGEGVGDDDRRLSEHHSVHNPERNTGYEYDVHAQGEGTGVLCPHGFDHLRQEGGGGEGPGGKPEERRVVH